MDEESKEPNEIDPVVSKHTKANVVKSFNEKVEKSYLFHFFSLIYIFTNVAQI